MKHIVAYSLFAATSVTAVQAEPPKVVTDIAPIQSLVAQVMDGVGTPLQVMPANASPHHHAMRPSEARMLSQADVVIWVGHTLTPWLEGPIENLAGGAQVLELMDAEGVHLLSYREGALFSGGHDHGHGDEAEHEGDDHGQDDAHADEKEHDHEEEHAHEEEHDHEEEHADEDAHAHEDEHKHEDEHAHKDDHGDEDDHGHEDTHDHGKEAGGASDPHVWLDPENGILFLDMIAAQLSKVDPDNASLYARNAAAGQERIRTTEAEITEQLAEVRGVPFIVLHDGFHYFEHHFDIEAIGSISDGDAQSPGAARITALREALPDSGLRCAFSEPDTGARLINTVTEGLSVDTAVLDPMGFDIPAGPMLYTELLKLIAGGMHGCLAS